MVPPNSAHALSVEIHNKTIPAAENTIRPISEASSAGLFSAAAVASLLGFRIGLTLTDSGVIQVASGLSSPADIVDEVCEELCWCAANTAGIIVAAMKAVGRILKASGP